MHPLLESTPAQRTPAREETPAAEAVAWLEDPQPPPPQLTSQQAAIAEVWQGIADAIGWPLSLVKEGIAELNEYDPEKRKCLVSRQTKLWQSCASNSGPSNEPPCATAEPPSPNSQATKSADAEKPTRATSE